MPVPDISTLALKLLAWKKGKLRHSQQNKGKVIPIGAKEEYAGVDV
jgi:hypothetical protein